MGTYESDGSYTPSSEDIAKACERIQARWTETERQNRMGHRQSDQDGYEIPQAKSVSIHRRGFSESRD